MANGKLRCILLGHTDGVTDCAISPNASYIVSTSLDTSVRVWDVLSGDIRFTLMHTWHEKYGGWLESDSTEKHWAAVRGCAISPDGALIASASSDQRLINMERLQWTSASRTLRS